MKKYIVYILGIAISLLTGVIVEPSIRKVDTTGLIDFKVANDESLYMLNHNREGQYNLKRVSKNGRIIFSVPLDENGDSEVCSYTRIEVDNDNNSYITKEVLSVPKENEDVQVLREEIIRFGLNGQSLGTIATIKLNDQDDILYNTVINRIKIVNTKIKIICSNGKVGHLLEVDIDGREKPREIGTFLFENYIESKEQWLCDSIVTSKNQILYADKRGHMYYVDNGSTVEIDQIINQKITPSFLSIDSEDNIYFTDINEEALYKVDIENKTFDVVYYGEEIVNDKEKIKFNDIQLTFLLSKGNYYGAINCSNNIKYINFGQNQYIINQIKHDKLSTLVEILAISIITFTAFLAIMFLAKKIGNRKTLTMRIFIQFSPIFFIVSLVLMTSLVSIIFNIRRSSTISYKKAGIKIMSNWINRDKFSSIDHLHDYLSSDYIDLENSIKDGFLKISDVSNNVNIYSVVNDKIYRLYNLSSEKSNLKSKREFVNLPKIPITYVMNTDLFGKYYAALKESKKNSLDEITMDFEDERGKWTSVMIFLKDSKGKTIGFIESQLDYFLNKADPKSNFSYFILLIFSIFITISLLYLYFLLKISLAPIKKIQNGIEKVEKGHYDFKLEILRRDELGDICRCVNNMAENVYKKVSDLVLINDEYTKYVPKEMFVLIDKSNIIDISILDKKVKKVYELKVYFIGKKMLSDINLSIQEYFEIIYNNFNSIFRTVERNNGVIQSFDGFNFTISFLKNGIDMIRAAVEMGDSIKDERISQSMKMILYSENMLIGVIGNEERKNIIAMSSMNILLDKFISIHSNFSSRYILTDDIFEIIKNEIDCRFIGVIKDNYQNRKVGLYELLVYKGLKKKEVFEQGLNLFLKGDFEDARRLFTNFICANRNDEVSMYYIKLCEKYANKKIEKWEGLMM